MNTSNEPKVMGFYKEYEGHEELTTALKGDTDSLYVDITAGFRNRMEIVVGNKIRVLVASIIDAQGTVLRDIYEEALCEIVGYWNELHFPSDFINEHNLKRGVILKLYLKSVIQFGGIERRT